MISLIQSDSSYILPVLIVKRKRMYQIKSAWTAKSKLLFYILSTARVILGQVFSICSCGF